MNAQPCAFRAPPEDVDCGAAAASSDTDDDAKSDSDDANRPSAKAPKRGAAATAVRRRRGKQTASALRRGESPQTASDLGVSANPKGTTTAGAAATRSPASKLKNVTNAVTQSKAPAKRYVRGRDEDGTRFRPVAYSRALPPFLPTVYEQHQKYQNQDRAKRGQCQGATE